MPLTLLNCFSRPNLKFITLLAGIRLLLEYQEITRIRMKFSVQQCFKDIFIRLHAHSLSKFRNQDHIL